MLFELFIDFIIAYYFDKNIKASPYLLKKYINQFYLYINKVLYCNQTADNTL
jgi:hypothetical protein